MTPAEFDRILELYQQDKLPEKQRALLEQWLDTRAEYDHTHTISDERMAELKSDFMRRISATPKSRTLIPMVWRAAAAIAVLAVASFVIWQWQEVEILTVNNVSQTQKVFLPDGSIIWLKENSSLTYPEKFTGDSRTVSFTGEALFEIAKDKDHPFIIESGQLTAKVLGTSFNIKTTAKEIAVIVLTGKVSLSANDNKPLMVTAQEKAVYNQTFNHIAKAELKSDEAVQIISGTEYNMLFENVAVADVVKRMAEKFDVTVTLDNEAMKHCRITMDCTDRSLEATLQAISETLGYTYQVDRKSIVLTGEGCP